MVVFFLLPGKKENLSLPGVKGTCEVFHLLRVEAIPFTCYIKSKIIILLYRQKQPLKTTINKGFHRKQDNPKSKRSLYQSLRKLY